MINRFRFIFSFLLFFFLFSCNNVKRKNIQQSIESKQIEQYYHEGITNLANQKYYLAIQSFNNVLELDSSYSKAFVSRGCTKAALKDFFGAIADFDKAISINNYDTVAYYNRGVAFGRLKKYKYALNDFNTSIQLNKNYADAYEARGMIKLLLHRKDGCLDLSKAGELGSIKAYSLIKQFCN